MNKIDIKGSTFSEQDYVFSGKKRFKGFIHFELIRNFRRKKKIKKVFT